MAKISVIVPAYNAETTLRTAVESILSQQVPELEIVIVNDGSTDGTDRLCHTLASECPCIHVITQKNAGICAARNRGMEAASGEYITFCDDDDLFWQGALHLLLQTAEDTRADLVRGGYELLRQRPDGTFAEQPHPAGSPCTIALGRGGSYGAFLENSGPQFVWNALYRRTALLGLRFNERCSYGLEDFVFNAAAYRRVGKAVYIPQVVYRHFESAQSTSCAHTAQALLGRIRALEPWMEAEFRPALVRPGGAAGRLEGPPRTGRHFFDAPAARRTRPGRAAPQGLAHAAGGPGPVPGQPAGHPARRRAQ